MRGVRCLRAMAVIVAQAGIDDGLRHGLAAFTAERLAGPIEDDGMPPSGVSGLSAVEAGNRGRGRCRDDRIGVGQRIEKKRFRENGAGSADHLLLKEG